MPNLRLTWSSWNYLTLINEETKSQQLSLSYWMNKLQPYATEKEYGPVVVTMNPLWEPEKDKVLGEWDYTHPLYTPETIAAQDQLNLIQNKHNSTFAGAWTNYGFHEDGVTSGLLAATSLGAKCPFPIILNGGYPTHREAPPVPYWAQAKGVSRFRCGKPTYIGNNKPKTGLTAGEIRVFGFVVFALLGAAVGIVALLLK
ncbi:hypothetical protein HK096_002145 [Nowakowskiella sp. JEL0078]|nr:hypothetical protein HK096_002145 [Nowakowskiella sp. JEL0078]